jgi:hypothetical protein
MRCPECIGILEEFNTHGVKLDRYDTCRALWFDRSELEAYLSRQPRWKRKSPGLPSRRRVDLRGGWFRRPARDLRSARRRIVGPNGSGSRRHHPHEEAEICRARLTTSVWRVRVTLPQKSLGSEKR